jgi:hypothetical protein
VQDVTKRNTSNAIASTDDQIMCHHSSVTAEIVDLNCCNSDGCDVLHYYTFLTLMYIMYGVILNDCSPSWHNN